jgi:hypothetical protein
MSVNLLRLFFVVAVLAVLASCTREPASTTGDELLAVVPADAPYAFVSSRPMPEALRERLGDHYARQLASQRAMVARMQQQLASTEQVDTLSEELGQLFVVLNAVLREFEGRETAASLRELGIEPVTRSVLYGIGLLPALRVEIADAARLGATLDRIEKRAGLAAARGTLDEQEYRRIDLGKTDLVIAVTASELVVGLLLDTLFERDLPLLLGQQNPSPSLADSGEISDLIARHGFAGYGEGFIDLEAIVAVLIGDGSGRARETVEVLGLATDVPSAGCRQLARGLVEGAPRLVMGVTAADEHKIEVRGIWETTPGVAAYLQKLAAPVPGVGVPGDGLISVGAGMDMPQLRNAIEALLTEITEQGSACESVDPDVMKAIMPQLNLALGPLTAGIKGFNLQIDDVQIDPGTLQPTQVRGGLLAAVDDPRGVFALGAMLNPELARIRLPQDGSFITLPQAHAIAGELPPVRVAARDNALLLVTGADTDGIARQLASTGMLTPAPLMAVDYGVAQLVERFGPMIDNVTQQLRDRGEHDAAAEIEEQLESFRLQAQVFERSRVVVYATDAGLVTDQVMELR